MNQGRSLSPDPDLDDSNNLQNPLLLSDNDITPDVSGLLTATHQVSEFSHFKFTESDFGIHQRSNRRSSSDGEEEKVEEGEEEKEEEGDEGEEENHNPDRDELENLEEEDDEDDFFEEDEEQESEKLGQSEEQKLSSGLPKTKEEQTRLKTEIITEAIEDSEAVEQANLEDERKKGLTIHINRIRNMLVHEHYNPYIFPAQLKSAEKHFSCSGVGYIDESECCRCCLNYGKKLIPLWKNPKNVEGIGNTIPLYFQYTEYCLVFCLILSLAFLKYALGLRSVYCNWVEKYPELAGETECHLFSLEPFYNYPAVFYNDSDVTTEILEQVKIGLYFFMAGLFFLLQLPFFYRRWQQVLIEKHKQLDGVSASDFTLMIRDVSDSTKKTKVQEFFDQIFLKSIKYVKSLKGVKVEKVNLAVYEKVLNDYEEEIVALNNENNVIKTAIQEQLRTSQVVVVPQDWVAPNPFDNTNVQLPKNNQHMTYEDDLFGLGLDEDPNTMELNLNLEKIKKRMKKKKKKKINKKHWKDSYKAQLYFQYLYKNQYRMGKLAESKQMLMADGKKILKTRPHSIAFVTFESTRARDRALRSFKIYKHRRCLCFNRLPKEFRKWRVEIPDEPENILWKNVGYSWFEVNISLLFISALSILVVAIFVSLIGGFVYLFTRFVSKIDTQNQYVQIALKGFNFLVVQILGLTSRKLYEKYIGFQRSISFTWSLEMKAAVLSYSKVLSLFLVSRLGKDTKPKYSETHFVAPFILTNTQVNYLLSSFMLQTVVVPLTSYYNSSNIINWLRVWKTRLSRKESIFVMQSKLNGLFTKPSSRLEMLYSTNNYVLLVVCGFVGICPIIPVVGVVFLFVKLILERLFFYRMFRKPIQRSDLLAKGMLEESLLAIKLLLGCTIFMTYRETWSLVVAVALFFTPFRWMMRSKVFTGIDRMKRARVGDAADQGIYGPINKKFEDVERRLMVDYDRVNPWSKRKAKNEWLQRNKQKILVDMKDRGEDDTEFVSQFFFL